MNVFTEGDKVNISGENDYNSGVIHLILTSNLDPDWIGHVVKINREKQVDHQWGVNCVLIDYHKLSHATVAA